MILSKQKVDKLLEIFSDPKSISLYDNTIEKQEMKNASNFIQNYHIYGSPINYTNSSKAKNETNYNNNLAKLKTINSQMSQNNSFYQKSIIDNKTLTNPEDLEIKQSLTNLRIGQKNYKKEQELNEQKKFLKSNLFSYNNNAYNYSQNPNLFSPIINMSDSYNQNLNDLNYTGLEPYTSNINQIKISSKISGSRALRDIPSNPDDVVIKELPPTYTQIMNPISSSNINYIPNNSNINEMPVVESNVVPMTEEINTDLMQNEEMQGMNPEEASLVQPIDILNGKYPVTNFNGPIKLPQGYSASSEAEFNAIQIINDDLSTWKLQIDKPNYKIYSKSFNTIDIKGKEVESKMYYLDATIDYPASEVNKQINSFELRQNWDESLKKGKLIKEQDLGNGIKTIDYHGFIKMPITFANRDIVARKTIWQNYNGERDACLNEIHSIENSKFPIKEKPVRATILNKSKYIKPIDNNRTKFYYVNKCDLKLNVAAPKMEDKGAKIIENWFNDFLQQLGK